MNKERDEEILKYIRGVYGYHGGMGDPPDDDTILGITRSFEEFLEHGDSK